MFLPLALFVPIILCGHYDSYYGTSSCSSPPVLVDYVNFCCSQTPGDSFLPVSCSSANSIYNQRVYNQPGCNEGDFDVVQNVSFADCETWNDFYLSTSCSFEEQTPQKVSITTYDSQDGGCDGNTISVLYIEPNECVGSMHLSFFLKVIPNVWSASSYESATFQSFSDSDCEIQIDSMDMSLVDCVDFSTSVIGYDVQATLYGWNECNGLKSTDPAVCSSHGKCLNSGHCECAYNYNSDPFCAKWSCDGKDKDDDEVCNSNGNCISANLCDCNDDGQDYDSNCLLIEENERGDDNNDDDESNAGMIATIIAVPTGVLAIVFCGVWIIGMFFFFRKMRSTRSEYVRISKVVESRRLLDSQLKNLRSTLTPEDFKGLDMKKLREIQKEFMKADGDWDGKISKEELKKGYKNADPEVSDDILDEIVKEIFEEADAKEDVLDFLGFFTFMKNKEEMEESGEIPGEKKEKETTGEDVELEEK